MNIIVEEIVAQQNAIKDELSNNLADESPQAQEIQEAKKQLLKMKNKKKQMHLRHNVEQFNQKHQAIWQTNHHKRKKYKKLKRSNC